MTRTNETIKINSELKIVKIGKRAWCFKHPELGYLGFTNDKAIYTPIGGKKALEDIMNAGGFLSFEGMTFYKD